MIMAFERLQVENLRKGLYVKLECSWWKHPFATNKFMITSQKEIQIIKGISNLKLFYDPQLSNQGPIEQEEEALSDYESPITTDEPILPSQDPSEDLTEDPYGDHHTEEEIPSYLQGDREDRVLALQKRRTQLQQTQRSFEEAAQQTKVALRSISSGDAVGLGSAKQVSSKLTQSLSNDRTVMALLEVMNTGEEKDSLFVHSMNVCVLSLLIGKELGLTEEELESLGIGALVHDIGFLSIPRQVNLTASGFVRSGSDTKQHIHHGLAAVNRIPDFPNASLKIVSQHHERLNGNGYPERLTDGEISPLAKIVMIVDEYDDLCNNPDRSVNYTPYEALSLMYKNATVDKKGEFDTAIIILLIQSLGVYPPGTMVELNDGSVGVVISINPTMRTKPQVMLYVKEVPIDEAVIADLAQDQDLNIERSLRPNEVSKEIKKYLNPHQLTAYFPSSKPSFSEYLASGSNQKYGSLGDPR